MEGNASNQEISNPFPYTGREDDGTGLYYYRNRYYDPELEVFISQDLMGEAQRYGAGNPLIFIDPLGFAADAIFLNSFIFDRDVRLYQNAQKIQNNPDSYEIVIHGDENGYVYVPHTIPVPIKFNGYGYLYSFYEPYTIEKFYKKYIQNNKYIKNKAQ